MPLRKNPRIIERVAAVLLANSALPAVPANAEDVGAAAAVNPLSHGTPPDRGTRVLQIGAPVVHNERIDTNASGTVQLLFLDKTTLSIGPDSSIVIDSFVYDPATSTGEMVTSLTKGALRFVGGQLSHQGAATVRTTAAATGIRGGIANILHGPKGTRIVNNFGWLTVTNGCGTTVIRRTGFAVTVADWTSCPTEPERVSQSEINQYLELLTSKPGQTGGAPTIPTDALVAQFGIGQPDGPFEPGGQLIQQQTTNVENVTFDIIVQATQKAIVRGVQPAPPRPTPPPSPPPTSPSSPPGGGGAPGR